MVTSESRLPYDRTRLSKKPTKAFEDEGSLVWRKPGFFLQVRRVNHRHCFLGWCLMLLDHAC